MYSPGGVCVEAEVIDQGVRNNPQQVLGSYVCPTIGAYCILATQGLIKRDANFYALSTKGERDVNAAISGKGKVVNGEGV